MITIPQQWNEPHPLLNTVGSVDHTHIKIGRTRYDQRRFYRADKGHAIIGQITVDRCGKIIHVAFGYRGSSNDQLVLSLSNLLTLLPDDMKLCADGGFSSKKFGVHLVTPTDITKNEELKHMQKVERVIVECTIGFIKRHEILASRFRMDICLLPVVVCSMLTNRFMEQTSHPNTREGTIVRQKTNRQKPT